MQFGEMFKALTGYEPLSWQRRLYNEWFAGDIKPVIDLPTGMGKTSLMAIWFIARAKQLAEKKPNPLPTRLVYVVDRRTVVDQATALAEKLATESKAIALEPPAISTLRGQHADNREWSRDPSKPAIIIGTVDLIGSGLLFSGYRSSYKRRPLEAGLLGQDSLLILDEAHLSKPFEKLINEICDRGRFQKDRDGKLCGMPMKVVRMSATSGDGMEKDCFQLEDSDLVPEVPDYHGELVANPVVLRFNAKKTLTIKVDVDRNKLHDATANAAIELAQDSNLKGKRIVVFVRSPNDATNIADAILKKIAKNGKVNDRVEILTGTMRGLERDELLAKQVFKDRWLNGDIDPADEKNQRSVFLVSTSAGEVGFDLNADHMVCDAAPLDSMIQRLGRVNRRGAGDATIALIKENKPADKTDFDKACIATSDLLTDGMDVSPKALAVFKKSLTPKQIDRASSPRPTRVELTDILLDAWSMTSIIKPMPGRPEVGPWLRGIAEKLPQTTIAWRAELELFRDQPNSEKMLKAAFVKHPIRHHESITTYSYRVIEFLKQIVKSKGGQPDLAATLLAIRLSRGEIVIRTVSKLISDSGILNAEPTLFLPATFGGLDSAGMLSADAIPPLPNADEPPLSSLDVADAEHYESREDLTTRGRILLLRTEHGWKPAPLPFAGSRSASIVENLALGDGSHRRTDITNALRSKLMLRTRQIIDLDLDEEGEPRKRLLLLSGIEKQVKKESQPLAEHVNAVEIEAKRIADDLHLTSDDAVRRALLFAAKWHDEGKGTPTWQRFIGGPEPDGQLRGKSDKYCDPKKLAHYRHEFGSLLRVLHPNPAESGEKPELPTDEHIRDLALHLIAVHHGHGRPHFTTPVDRDFHKPSLIDETHTDAIRRFARLQRKHGWWHLAWLENLLRCADRIASEQIHGPTDDQEDDTAEEEG